jgi:UDP-glucose 4-epimerase
MMEQLSANSDFSYVALRYFNASGAHKSGTIGEAHNPESHLIPIVLQVALGQRENIKIFGTDYPTEDGTCVRDYIHVSDLASGHLMAMEHLMNGGESLAMNIGTGQGYSVKEIIDVCRKVTGHEIPAIEEARRPGDPPKLYANPAMIKEKFGWEPKESDIESLVKSAWEWHKNHPNGYKN